MRLKTRSSKKFLKYQLTYIAKTNMVTRFGYAWRLQNEKKKIFFKLPNRCVIFKKKPQTTTKSFFSYILSFKRVFLMYYYVPTIHGTFCLFVRIWKKASPFFLIPIICSPFAVCSVVYIFILASLSSLDAVDVRSSSFA